MKKIIDFEINAVFDNKLFYKYVWKEFYTLIFEDKYKNIIINLNNIKIIKPEVLPKLCCLGMLAKQQGAQVELNIDPYSKVKNFLGNIGFFDIVMKKDIFLLDEGQIWDIQNSNRSTNAFFVFEKNLILEKYEKKYIFGEGIESKEKLKYCLEAEIFGEEYMFAPGIITDDMIKKSSVLSVLSQAYDNKNLSKIEFLNNTGLDLIELIHNSLWYGNNMCFFSVQAATYKYYEDTEEKEFARVDLCVSDLGIGLYETLRKKEWIKINKAPQTMSLDRFLSLSTENDKNYYSILEMIYYRGYDNDRGVYDLIKNLQEKENIKINIINKNTQIYLKRDTIKYILSRDRKAKYIVARKENIGYGFSMDISFNV